MESGQTHLMLTTASLEDNSDACCAPAIQRVRWYLKDRVLYREVWQYPDAIKPTLTLPMLDEVDNFTLRYNAQGSFLEKTDAITALPQAVEFTLELNNPGTITRLVRLPEQHSQTQKISPATPEKQP